jgi:peptide chain release factor subunit 1
MSKPAPKVLVLTPVKDAERHLERYVANIEALDYPKQSLSIGLLEGDSRDATMAGLERLRPRLEARADRVTIVKRDFGFRLPGGVPRWTPAFQQKRRAVLARSRNHLLFASLRDEEWVLWLDVDVVSYPGDLVWRLLAFERDIVHPNCVCIPGGPTFDLNGWRDHGRRYLHDLRHEPQPVRLDAVGATVLLIRADRHRDGLVFPPFPYGRQNPRMRPYHEVWGQGEIESEGLGMLAYDMGCQCWGVADLEVLHAPE